MQLLLATRKRVFLKAFLREEGGTRQRDGRSLRHFGVFLALLLTVTTSFSRSPPVTFGDSPLPEGAFHTTSFHPIPTALPIIGIAYTEPRHYGGLFVIQ